MSENKDHNEQFDQYLRGKMTPDEMHAFERENLDDAFTQEALEGFESSGVHHLEDINRLKNRITKNKDQGMIWWKYASVAAILLITAYFIVLSINQLSVDAPKLSDNLESDDSSPFKEPIPDSIPSQKQNEGEKNVTNPGSMQESSRVTSSAAKENDDSSLDLNREQNEPSEVEEGPYVLEEKVRVDMDLASNQDSLALDIASATPMKYQKVLVAEDSSVDQISRPESISQTLQGQVSGVQVEESFSNNTSEPRQLTARVMNEDSNDIAERVVTSTLKKEKKALSKDVSSNPDKKPKPSSGKELFDEYIVKNLKYPQPAIDNKIEGTVVLLLTIESSGVISHIEIKKSLGYGCNEEAIRLIEEGPEWIPAERNGIAVEDQVRVKIQFKL